MDDKERIEKEELLIAFEKSITHLESASNRASQAITRVIRSVTLANGAGVIAMLGLIGTIVGSSESGMFSRHLLWPLGLFVSGFLLGVIGEGSWGMKLALKDSLRALKTDRRNPERSGVSSAENEHRLFDRITFLSAVLSSVCLWSAIVKVGFILYALSH